MALSHSVRRALPAGFATLIACSVAACSAESDIVPVSGSGGAPDTTEIIVKPTVVQGDASVARDAVVSEDGTRVTLPAAAHQNLLSLEPGRVLLFDRAPDMNPNNPLGFMGIVQSVQTDGDRIVILATGATVNDVFDKFVLSTTPSGDLTPLQNGQPAEDFSFGFPLGLTIGRTLPNLADIAGGNGAEIQMSGGFGVQVRGGGSIQADLIRLYPNLDINLRFGLGAELALCAKLEGKVRAGANSDDGIVGFEKVEIPVGEVSLPDVPVPIPAGPVPVTLRFQPKLFCGFNYLASVGAAYQLRRDWELTTSFGLRAGEGYGNSSFLDSGNQHRWEFVLRGSMGLVCGLEIKAGLYVANSIGAYVKLLPKAEMGIGGAARLAGSSNQPTPRADYQLCAGVDAVLESKWGVEASFFGLSNPSALVNDRELFAAQRFPIPFPLQACTGSASVTDSCVGKADGSYCSLIDTHAGFTCRAGSTIAGLVPCIGGEYCRSNNGMQGGATTPAAGGQAACTPTPPRIAPLDLSFCPRAPSFLTAPDPAPSE